MRQHHRTCRRIAIAAAIVLVATSARAQERGMIEGGMDTMSVFIGPVTVTERGLYAGVLGNVNERVGAYGTLGAIYGSGVTITLIKGGGEVRLGPEDWIVRPALRGGIAYLEGNVYGTGGWGVSIGRAYGVRYTVDISRESGLLIEPAQGFGRSAGLGSCRAAPGA